MTTVSTRTALLQALREGPGHGRELMRRVAAMTGGELRLGPGRAYPALRSLLDEHLIAARRVTPRGARGARSRVCYELTERGVLVAARQAGVLRALAGGRPREAPGAAERLRMARRLVEADALARLAGDLGAALRARAGRSG